MPRPREFDADQAVAAAMGVFWEKGFAATSAQDLVDRTGLGRGSLYNAFTSKHHLFEEALARYHDRNTAAEMGILDSADRPAKERIRELLMGIVETELGDPRRRGCLAVNAAIELAGRDEAVTARVSQIFDHVEEALRAAIDEGQRTGEITRARDARALARFVLNAMYGLRVLGKVTDDRRRLVDIVETTLDVL